ncbi:dipeptide/oligopeptide/nickel ABC transporter permease/ATP-binding protein [Acuticoccus sp. I52.16.1]|uniref:dipeptide/oligopeptide/nickel ABC transporter permease/ATP-binding protein n=1 Tax=Acuticoccus sp. I52.16.1 TaxID=2928472 RepID=UPI001FD25893|nr:dipeptide/oligopeptide/nickel ABC transporter permease/ATP-binding protein [Acuticoccus sp. I52.16.1]UOM34457.1 dipeptide/oligopeptide/nickel ABC transporter permease/ATP-binding protein [Acuticoccus sp. I52.16.1]
MSVTDAIAPATQPSRPSSWQLLFNNTLATIGLAVIVLVLAVALAAPWLPLADPNATAPAARLAPPLTDGHLLGTDALGRDILSRLVWGTRISLAVGLTATAIAAFFGSLIGLVAGYAGGRVDAVLMRGVDMVLAFPYILLALAIVAALGPGLINALYAIAIVNVPFFARNVRGLALGLARREFVDAARLSGQGNVAILLSEVLPNVLPVIVITMSTTVGWMILETAGLSFLGLGAQPPQADLGSMLGDGRTVLFNAPHVAIIPGVMIFVVVMAINLLGDGVRDVLDPRLKSGALARPGARTRVARDHVPEPARLGALLDVTGLRTSFRVGRSRVQAVRGVDLAVGEGECLGVVGESGSGKSVTGMSVMGLVPSPPGEIVAGAAYFRGRDLFGLGDGALRRMRGAAVAYVFQDPLSTLHPQFTVGQQIVEALQAHAPIGRRAARERAEALLALVRIPNPARRLDAYPHQLSGGMRQRVGIAMALANEADVLVADEPTTALDVTVQAQILGLINRLRRQETVAVIFITHDFGVVSAVTDRVAVMYAGEVVETGPTAEILAAPAHPYTERLIACVPVLGDPDRKVKAIPGRPPSLVDPPPGCAFAPRCLRAEDDCRAGPIPLLERAPGRAARCIHPLDAPA